MEQLKQYFVHTRTKPLIMCSRKRLS